MLDAPTSSAVLVSTKSTRRQRAALVEAALAKRGRKWENAAWAVFARLPICAENS